MVYYLQHSPYTVPANKALFSNVILVTNAFIKAGKNMPADNPKTTARLLMRENAPKVFFVSIVYLLLITVMGELQVRLPGTLGVYDHYLQQLADGQLPGIGSIYSYLRPSGIPFAIVLWLLSSVLDTGLKSYCLKLSRGLGGEYKDLFDGFLFPGKAIAITVLTGVFTALWSLLLVFPGIIAHYRYRQAYYILLDDPKKGVLQCIRESKQLMRGNKLDLFLLDLSFLGWALLSYLVAILLPLPFSLPIVNIWFTPYFGLTCAAFYNRLIGRLTV